MTTPNDPAPPMMRCGHAANARRDDGRPSCAICVGIDPGADVIDTTPPPLAGRRIVCSYGCGTAVGGVPSDPRAAFFASCPTQPFDRYY